MCIRIYIVDKEIVQHGVVSVKCVMLCTNTGTQAYHQSGHGLHLRRQKVTSSETPLSHSSSRRGG